MQSCFIVKYIFSEIYTCLAADVVTYTAMVHKFSNNYDLLIHLQIYIYTMDILRNKQTFNVVH